ncbi:MAG: hypothetical protein AAF840_01755 [Bacteroidota bacterium]
MARKYSDAIKAFLGGELHFAELTYKERDYLEQLKLIEGLWAEGKPDVYVRTAVEEKFHVTGNTARKLMRECMTVFGDLKTVNRNMMRYRASQMALRAYELAEEAGNVKAMITATKAFIEANGLNNEDPDLPDFENLEAAPIIGVLPKGMEPLLQKLLAAGGVIDQTELPDLPPEPETLDISYIDESES